MKLVNVVVLLFAVSVAQAEPDLAGFWQHEKAPVWIEMAPGAGEGVVVRNDNQPERVGFRVVKDLEAGSQPGKWSGQVFAARLGSIVTLPSPLSQTIAWRLPSRWA